jgi:hypothetical protein
MRRVLRTASVVAVAVSALAGLQPAAAWTTIDDFNKDHFSSAGSTTISNRWLPLRPGTQFVLEGTANRGSAGAAHNVIFTVTDVVKWINGVRTLVMWDRDVNDGQLVEEELAFFAQDKDGTVWAMGEYPEELERGKVTGAPGTWIAGVDGARAGIAMHAKPQLGSPAYVQGFAPAVDFFDKAVVSKVGQRTCVPVACYRNALVIDEWDPNQQPEDGHQFKFHAPGVGVVRIEARGGVEQETLVLTKLRRLGRAEMEQARARTLELDRRAYDLARHVYRHTAPAKPLG